MLTETILARFRDGDPDAFAAVVRTSSGLVRRVVGRFTRSPFEQEEMMQEVWMHLYSRREAVDPARAASFRGWLAVTARNKCIEIQRRAGRAVVEVPDADLEALAGSPADAEPVGAEHRELADALEALKEQLEPQWRQFFDLYFVRGLDYETICVRLGISRTRCKYMKKVLAARARRNPRLLEALGRSRGPA